jgi:hypothetical protein
MRKFWGRQETARARFDENPGETGGIAEWAGSHGWESPGIYPVRQKLWSPKPVLTKPPGKNVKKVKKLLTK